MKYILTLILIYSVTFLNAQNKIIKLDFENRSFKNANELPYGKSFLIEGEVAKDISFIEIVTKYHNSSNAIGTYHWDRAENNLTESFEMVMQNPLKSNTKYDFRVATYRKMTEQQKLQLSQELTKRVVYYIRSNIEVNGKNVSIENPRKVTNGLNELLQNGLQYQRSTNGIQFMALSGIVEEEIRRLGDINLKKVFKLKKTESEDNVSSEIINTKLNYLAELVLSEIKPFLSSDLVQQHKSFSIEGIETEKERFTLPINAGMYVWNTNTNINNIGVSNTSLTPGIGFTLPFSRGVQLKDRSINSLGLSFGVLLSPIENASNVKLATPGINLPVYGALGINVFRFIRLNAGTLIVKEIDATSIGNLQFYPTLGIAFELNLWVGAK